jgi:1,4-dihydroxy-6-naphthoate synthase
MLGALVSGLIDTEGLAFEPVIEDVESLNRRALGGELDVSKLSFCAYAFASQHYAVLPAGAALGRSCGPLIVAREKTDTGLLPRLRLAIPGKYTTANLLTGLFFPAAKNKTEMVFSEIEDAVASGRADAGVIIHESRFTFEKKGLVAIADLGALWEERMHPLLPLGCLAVRRPLPRDVRARIAALIAQSVRYAMKDPASVMPFVRAHAAETEEAVMKQHIALYVNEYSIALDEPAREAISLLLKEGHRSGLLPPLAAEPLGG